MSLILTVDIDIEHNDTRYRKGSGYGPSITYKITPAGPLSSSQPVRPPRWTSPLAFGLVIVTVIVIIIEAVHGEDVNYMLCRIYPA